MKWFNDRVLAASAAVLLAAMAGGCTSYATPGAGADLRAMTTERRVAEADRAVRPALETKPTARFPAAIATVRLQAPGYRSETVQTIGGGEVSVVITRDVETDEQYARLARMPLVHGAAPVGRLLLPAQIKGEESLRYAAGRMRADMLLVYTFDTTFETRDRAAPLTVISLGLFPTQNVRMVTTASAVLLDTGTGFVYGVAEATVRDDTTASAWTTSRAVDDARLATEAKAFEKLIGEIERAWGGIVKEFAAGQGVYPTTVP